MPRIAYWTSAYDPDIEAVASEVAALRQAFPQSVTWGLNAHRWLQCSWRRGFIWHPRLHWWFHAATTVAQHAVDINHVFGSLGDWFHLRAVWKRPVVLTQAVGPVGQTHTSLLGKISQFVVEWDEARNDLIETGVEAERVSLVYPGVDLERFHPSDDSADTFTALFASSPSQQEWLHARGVPALLDAAELCPDVHFVLVWRPWGDSLGVVRRWIKERELDNVEVRVGRFRDMSAHYRQAHVTIAPFVSRDLCKPTPNSLLESLACGRPVIATPSIGIAPLIERREAGSVCDATGESIARSLHQLRRNWRQFADNAHQCAQAHFGVRTFVESYARIYRSLSPAA